MSTAKGRKRKASFHFRRDRKGGAIPKQKRSARIRIPESPGTSWRAKVHPFFRKMVAYQTRVDKLAESSSAADREQAKRLVRGPLPDHLIKEALRVNRQLEKSGGLRYQARIHMLGLEDLPPGSTISIGDYMFAAMCWYKYGKTIKELLEQSNAGSPKASTQFLNLMRDYDRWRFGKPHRRQSGSKFDLNHHSLMTSGLDLGLEKLTAGELADCFDELCSCGKEHSPENLRKLRNRMIKALERIKAGTKAVQERPALETN